MLLFRLASIVLVAGIQLVVAADAKPEFTPPEILTSAGDPDATLQPYVGNPVQADDVVNGTKLIRRLLMQRQSSCDSGFGLCKDGTCCQIGGGCCGGGKCCDPGYYCTLGGCCENGKICTSGGGGDSGCTTPGYIRCAGENFCCLSGNVCSRDSAGNPQCSPYSTYTTTSNSMIREPTSTSTNPRPTSTPNGGDNSSDNGLPDDSNSNSDSSNDSSSGNSNSDGLNSIGTSRLNGTSSSSSSRPTTPAFSSASNGVLDWKDCSSYFGLAPFLVFIACVL